jgi:hypothetical protein
MEAVVVDVRFTHTSPKVVPFVAPVAVCSDTLSTDSKPPPAMHVVLADAIDTSDIQTTAASSRRKAFIKLSSLTLNPNTRCNIIPGRSEP